MEVADGEEIPAAARAHRRSTRWTTTFDVDAFSAALRRRRTEVKRALLDQTLIGGVGNIYADEALWRARLHGARPTDRLTRAQVGDLLDGVRDVLGEALAQGGTSFDSLYVDVNGQSGYFSRFLAVYGQGDRPCPRCGTPIRRESFMNRSSYSCPHCQPRPQSAPGMNRRVRSPWSPATSRASATGGSSAELADAAGLAGRRPTCPTAGSRWCSREPDDAVAARARRAGRPAGARAR